jgi:ABC-2 type transport system permease protein
MLPPGFRRFTLANPIFYMVDGVRYGMLGVSDASPWTGAALLFGLAALAVLGTYALLRSGYELRG